MCVNYAPTRKERIDALVQVFTAGLPDWPAEAWQDYAAPIIRAGKEDKPELLVGTYGMLPKAHMPPAAKHFTTMNARAETIGQKQSYSKAWRQGQTCLIPTSWFYEPNYESGKAERWAIGMEDDSEFCVAGLWRAWEEPEGVQSFSFTQITINADDHPLMKRFHKPGDEKRSLVIVPTSEYDAWLDCKDPEVARSMLTLYPAEKMRAWSAPRAAKKTPTTEGLF